MAGSATAPPPPSPTSANGRRTKPVPAAKSPTPARLKKEKPRPLSAAGASRESFKQRLVSSAATPHQQPKTSQTKHGGGGLGDGGHANLGATERSVKHFRWLVDCRCGHRPRRGRRDCPSRVRKNRPLGRRLLRSRRRVQDENIETSSSGKSRICVVHVADGSRVVPARCTRWVDVIDGQRSIRAIRSGTRVLPNRNKSTVDCRKSSSTCGNTGREGTDSHHRSESKRGSRRCDDHASACCKTI